MLITAACWPVHYLAKGSALPATGAPFHGGPIRTLTGLAAPLRLTQPYRAKTRGLYPPPRQPNLPTRVTTHVLIGSGCLLAPRVAGLCKGCQRSRTDSSSHTNDVSSTEQLSALLWGSLVGEEGTLKYFCACARKRNLLGATSFS